MLTEPFEIRIATEGDFDAIIELNLASYDEYRTRFSPDSLDEMEAKLSDVKTFAERAVFMVVEYGTDLVGSVAYCPPGRSVPPFDPDWASILLLAVAPGARRMGLARMLVQRCVELAAMMEP